MGYYPVFLNLTGRACLVVGGGGVAERKALSLVDCGARVSVVAPEVTKGLRELAESGKIKLYNRQYQEGDLKGVFVAVAATDRDEINAAVADEARRRRVLLNVVDDPARCDFIVPSVVRSGQVTLAISTGGLSPALSRRLRQKLESFLGPEYGKLAEVLSEVRRELRSQGHRVSPEAWQKALGDDVLELVRRGQVAVARTQIWAVLVEKGGR